MHPFKRMVLDKESKAQYIPVPPALVRRLNSNAALLFMWLLDMHDIYSKLELNGWFFLVDKNMRETFGWGQDALKAAIDKLVKEGFLEKKRQGVGALVYYKIGSSESVVSLFSSELGKPQMQGAENPLPPTAELVQILENPKSETGKPQILNLENPKSDFGKSQIRNGKIPNQILENPNSELGKSHISNNISNKDLNNQTKNKEKEEEGADFTNPLPPAPKKSVAKKSKVWFSAERVNEIVFGLIQQFYPNQSKGWGDLLNEYFNNVKSAKTKSKNETAFLKTVQQDAERFLSYCSGAKIADNVVLAYLELATERTYTSLTKWGDYASKLKEIQTVTLKEVQAGLITVQDFRFTDERYFNFFVANILTPFKKIGIVQAAMDTAKSQKAQFGVLVSHLSSEMLTFGSELHYVVECLKRETIAYKTANPKPQKDFDFWLKNKGWEKFPAKAPKTTATAPQMAKAEPVQQTAPKAQISENKAPLPAPVPAVVSVPVSVVPIKEFLPQWLPGISYKYFVQDLVGKTSTKAGGFVYTMITEGVFNSESFIAWLKANIEGYPEASDIIDNKMRETWNALESQIKKAKTA